MCDQPIADHLAREMMTLAGIAYGAPANIPSYLANPGLATMGGWRIRWIAQDSWFPVNFAYLAETNAADPTKTRYALAIRGTYPNPLNPAYWEDASQDNPFGDFVDWPYPAGTGAQVSRGTSEGFQGVRALASSDGKTVEQALADLPAGTRLFVTGHSLGGTLAPVLAQWASTLPNAPEVQVLTFAGMTPGNQAFAELIGSRTRRFYNTLDSVPYGWNAVTQTKGFYQPAPQGGQLYRDAIDLMASKLAAYGYAAVGVAEVLEGAVTTTDDIPLVSFLIENLTQHLPDTYLTLLGAPTLPFTIGFGASVVPKDHPMLAAGAPPHALPATHVPAPA